MKTILPFVNPSDLQSDLALADHWDARAVGQVIKNKTRKGRRPSHLFLGTREADLLRRHLGTTFGPESVRSLRNTYYLGLEVIELGFPSFLRIAGTKQVRQSLPRRNQRPEWMEESSGSRWSFSA